MTHLTVALLQLQQHPADTRFALKRGVEACRQAADLGAEIAVFPEMWQIGYLPCPADNVGRRRWLDCAVPEDGEFVDAFRAIARELGLAVVITYLQEWTEAARNAATVIDRNGNVVLTYAKVHTCDYEMEAAVAPGDGFRAVDLDIGGDTARVGLMICYDREFPESARALMLDGAELVLTPNACALTAERLGQFRARAFENMLGVAMANYAAPGTDASEAIVNGHSVAFSGVCFDERNRPLDQLLIQAGPGEGIYLAEFDLNALRAYRARGVWADAYRKPWAYSALVDTSPPDAPFMRSDSRRKS